MKGRITYIYGLYEEGKVSEIKYIGKTLYPKERFRSHIKKFISNKEKSEWIKNVLNKDGVIKMVIIEECNENNWEERETYWIKKYGLENLTNVYSGGTTGKSYNISYDEFKIWVKNNLPNVQSVKEWKDCIKKGLIPIEIPKYPTKVYPEMRNWGEVFRTGKVHNIELTKNYLSYDDAKKYVSKFQFRSMSDWFIRYSEVDENILPKKPNRYYDKRGWKGWGDFLGTGNIKNNDKWKIIISYEDCKKFAKDNNINTKKEWFGFKNKPLNVPSTPNTMYDEWTNWMDFFDRIDKNIKFEYLSYNEAIDFLKSFNLKSCNDFKNFIKGKTKLYRIPCHPKEYYSNQWIDWSNFLQKKE